MKRPYDAGQTGQTADAKTTRVDQLGLGNIHGDQGRFSSLKGKLEFIETRRQAPYKVSIRTRLVQMGQKNWSQKWLKQNEREGEKTYWCVKEKSRGSSTFRDIVSRTLALLCHPELPFSVLASVSCSAWEQNDGGICHHYIPMGSQLHLLYLIGPRAHPSTSHCGWVRVML